MSYDLLYFPGFSSCFFFLHLPCNRLCRKDSGDSWRSEPEIRCETRPSLGKISPVWWKFDAKLSWRCLNLCIQFWWIFVPLGHKNAENTVAAFTVTVSLVSPSCGHLLLWSETTSGEKAEWFRSGKFPQKKPSSTSCLKLLKHSPFDYVVYLYEWVLVVLGCVLAVHYSSQSSIANQKYRNEEWGRIRHQFFCRTKQVPCIPCVSLWSESTSSTPAATAARAATTLELRTNNKIAHKIANYHYKIL